jgi:hypothetical protein
MNDEEEYSGNVGVFKWFVFRNADKDCEDKWLSYLEDEKFYIGGDSHKTRKSAETYIINLAKKENEKRILLGENYQEAKISDEIFVFVSKSN